MAPDSSTVVPLPTAPTRQEMLVTPKDVVITSAPIHPVVTDVLPKQVRIPVVSAMTHSTVATMDIAPAPQEVGQPQTQAPISARLQLRSH